MLTDPPALPAPPPEEAALRRRSRLRGLVLIALFLVVGIVYSLATPPFETPDEPFHYAFARYIAQGNGLPVQSATQTGPWAQEGSQAPLYYLLAGWLTGAIDQSDYPAVAVRNPRANIGDPLEPGNKNFMLYSGYQPPLRGANLALHIGRWLSLLCGALTLWCVYLTAELLAFALRRSAGQADAGLAPPQRVYLAAFIDLPLLATALVAAIPQFAFISASFSNDMLVTALAAAVVYWLARLLAKPNSEPVRWWEWLALGLLLGLAALSKLQALGLPPLAGLAVLFLAWRRRDGKLLLWAALLVGLPALLVSGWWYVRNIQLYGDWSGLGHLTSINGRRGKPLTAAAFWPEFRGLRYSFWGLFGWFNLLLPEWFYRFADLLTVAGIIGLAAACVRLLRTVPAPRLDHPALRILALLLGWAAVSLALLAYWIVQATGSQGRLIFPGMIAFGILLAVGVDFWLRLAGQRVRRLAWAGLLAVLLGMSAYTLTRLLPAAYAAPAPVATVPADAQPLNLTIGDAEPVQLLAVQTPSGRYHPGERVPVTLYWRAQQPLTHDYQLFIQLLDENGQEVANLTTHPGWGRNPTTRWQPGAIYPDAYAVLVDRPVDARAPLLARIYTGLIDPATEDADNLPLPARTADGAEVTPFVGTVEVSAWNPPTAADLLLAPIGSQPPGPVFGDVIALPAASFPPTATIQANTPLTVTLLWEAQGRPAAGYTAYVHLVDAAGQQVAGFDRQPAGDRFPTPHWQRGDRIVSELALPLAGVAPGSYALWVGLYESGSGGAVRMPVTDAAGLPAGDGQVQIGQVRVER